jgi:GTP-binding protein
MSEPSDLRNVAIIAHVDHGKTTLVDHMLGQSGVFRENEQVQERIMDNQDLERERGITIASKNAALMVDDTKINIVDTPGHSDFGGEVERILNMVDGAILLVDASEGPLPQTRFVLKNAIEMDLEIILCVNKIDRDDARISEVVDEVFELFMELGATDDQLDFPILYSAAIHGFAVEDPDQEGEDLEPLFNTILNHIPPPEVSEGQALELMVSDLDYDDYMGRLAVGRIRSGKISSGDTVRIQKKDSYEEVEIASVHVHEGLQRREVETASAGEIVAVSGVEGVSIGDTLTDPDNPSSLPRISVEEPTVGITIMPNDGPFASQEGEFVTGRKLLERLEKENRNNVAVELDETSETDRWHLRGRGQLQLAIVLEEIRREGYELLVGKPEVLTYEENGQELEPYERVVVDVPENYVGAVTEKLGDRNGEMEQYEPLQGNRVRLEFSVPTRGLIGYRSEFQTDTRGSGIITTTFDDYRPMNGTKTGRRTGALIADRDGTARSYALQNLEERGRLFVPPGTECYEGMIVGEHSKKSNLDVNVTDQKQLTNFRAAGSDDSIQLEPPVDVDIEFGLEWINDDELVEVTPESVRLRKKELDQRFR